MKDNQGKTAGEKSIKDLVSGVILTFLGGIFAVLAVLLAYVAVVTFKETHFFTGVLLTMLAIAALFPAAGGLTTGIKKLRAKKEHNNTCNRNDVSVTSPILAEFEHRQQAFVSAANAIPRAEITIAEIPAEGNAVKEAREQSFTNITRKSSLEKLSNFVAVDVETTGLHPSKAEIVEVAAIRFRDFSPAENFTTLCYPRKGIVPEAERINGITAEMVAGKPTFGQIAAALQAFIGDDNLVAHNLSFDLGFIVKHGVDISDSKRKYYDTLMLSEYVLSRSDVQNYKLPTLCRYYNIPYAEGHRSTIDAYAVGLLFKKLAEEKTGQKFHVNA